MRTSLGSFFGHVAVGAQHLVGVMVGVQDCLPHLGIEVLLPVLGRPTMNVVDTQEREVSLATARAFTSIHLDSLSPPSSAICGDSFLSSLLGQLLLVVLLPVVLGMLAFTAGGVKSIAPGPVLIELLVQLMCLALRAPFMVTTRTNSRFHI